MACKRCSHRWNRRTSPQDLSGSRHLSLQALSSMRLSYHLPQLPLLPLVLRSFWNNFLFPQASQLLRWSPDVHRLYLRMLWKDLRSLFLSTLIQVLDLLSQLQLPQPLSSPQLRILRRSVHPPELQQLPYAPGIQRLQALFRQVRRIFSELYLS